ncbi:MAG: 50S ribosomal protein L4, partial [Actinomycetia bacterium]|nr:50S ribosomal protein L4 [Actinomycetes bacterium]
ATIVISNDDIATKKSISNLPYARALSVSELNLYDLVDCSKLVITKDALETVTEVLKNVKR